MVELYKSASPIVTVIMVTYNRAEYLDRSIGSFLNQTFKNTELLVIDDGSEDNTFEVVLKYMMAHDNIRYLRHSNRNISLSKNVGLKAAAGRYITFLDSDDALKPDYLESRVDYMEHHPEMDMIEGGVIIIGNPYVKDRNNPERLIHLSECHIGATYFGKTEVFLSSGGYDKSITYSEDSQFWTKVEKKYKTGKFDYPGYIYYRDTPGSVCNTV